MNRSGFQKGDVVVLRQDIEREGTLFPAGTEGVVVASAGTRDYDVEILEPKPEIVRVPEAALDPVQP